MPSGTLLGAIGVSGDSSCADHNIAWRTRDALGLDHVPGGVAADGTDNIIYDLLIAYAGANPVSDSGFGHPICGESEPAQNQAIVNACPTGDGSTDGCITQN